jgi:uncharacterized delta-60 repeat protein
MNSSALSQFSVNTFLGRLLLFLATSAFLCQTAFSGILDITFGTGGRTIADFAPVQPTSIQENAFGRKIFVQPSGRIVCIGSHFGPGGVFPINSTALAGFTPNGVLDTSFGTNGIKLINQAFIGSFRYGDSIVRPDGRILLLGSTSSPKVQQRAAITEFNQDATGGTGFSGDVSGLGFSTTSEARFLALREDGKIYVLIAVNSSVSPYVIYRLNSNGSRDTSFGTNGAQSISFDRAGQPPIDMEAAPNNKLVFAFPDGKILRLDAEGFPDRTFGLLGLVSTVTSSGILVNNLIVQPDGKVLLLGGLSGHPQATALARVTDRGKLDGTFGTGGIAVSNIDDLISPSTLSGALSSDGKIFTAGQTRHPLHSKTSFFIAKYAADGTLEGTTFTAFQTTTGTGANAIAVQPDGKIVALGDGFSVPPWPHSIFNIARFLDIRSGESTIRRTYDFDGDGLTDFSIYRPNLQNTEQSLWAVSAALSSASASAFFGVNGDIPVPSDFNNDGKTDVAVFRPSTGTWFFSANFDAADYETVDFGEAGDIPIANDYDGDAKADFALFRPSSATWMIRSISDGSIRSVQFGASKDKPLTGDFDGDSKADLVVWRSSDATFRVLKSSDGQVLTRQLGTSADLPVLGDYDGDGKTDFAVYDPASGDWIIQRSSNGQTIQPNWGSPGDIPTPGDYDGDTLSDPAVFRPGTNTWSIKKSNDNGNLDKVFGQSTDILLPGR